MRWPFLALVVCACAAEAPLQQLVAVSPEPAGANCAHGGTAVAVGVDDDRDGVLEPGEVDSVSYACNGGNGSHVLVDTRPEAAGANCAHGGTAIRTGVDADENGALGDAEVQSTIYVCNGADGAAGTLVATQPEPPGANCSFGGTAILVGADVDGDGVLDPEEVTSESFVCDGSFGQVIAGNYTIHNDLDAALIAGVRRITGQLIVDAPIPALDLPMLERVGGIHLGTSLALRMSQLVTIDGPAMLSSATSLELPHLETVGNLFVFGGSAPIVLPELQRVGGAFSSGLPGSILSISAPKLAHLDGELDVFNQSQLSDLDLPSLTELAGVQLGGNAQLTIDHVHLPPVGTLATRMNLNMMPWTSLGPFASVTSCPDVELFALPLVDATLPALTTTKFFSVFGVPSSVSAPLLVSATTAIVIGTDGTSASFPALQSAGRLSISGAQLTDLAMPSIVAIGGPVNISADQLSACVVADIFARAGYTGPSTLSVKPCP